MARACAVPTTGIGGWGLCIRIGAQFQANRLVLVQTAVDNKPNASTAIPELLRMLCLKGCIVTLDAMGCQKAIARPIRQQGTDYVLRIRDNHKGLHARLEDTFALERAGHFASYAHDYAAPVGKDHGCIAIRRCWTTGDPALLAHADPDHQWCDLASLVWVECERRIGNRVTTDVRIFMFSLPPKARLQLQAVLRRWRVPSGCENAHYRVLDVAFGEDDSRIRTGYAAHNIDHPQAHRPQPPAAGPHPEGGHRQQAAGGGLGQELPVPTDRPRTQTNLDAIALAGRLERQLPGSRSCQIGM